MSRQTSAVSNRRLVSGLLAALLLAVAAVGAAAFSTTARAWFDQPLPGSHHALDAISVTTHATAPDGVNEVTLAVDGVQIGSLAFQSERLVTAQFQWQPEQEKGYTLTVRGRSGDVWGEPATVFVIVGPAPTTAVTPPPTPGAATSACQSAPALSEDFSGGSGPFETFDFGDVAAAVSDGTFHLTFTESGTITTSRARSVVR